MLFLTLATVLCPYNYCYYYFLLLCSDADKVDFIWASPLFSALRKVDIRSQAHKDEAELQGQVHHKPGDLLPLGALV